MVIAIQILISKMFYHFQALIAENLKHEDAMDLFRHATQLGIHTESCIGYSHWVCTTLKSNINRNHPEFIYGIKRMYAIPVAENCMIWYTGGLLQYFILSKFMF